MTPRWYPALKKAERLIETYGFTPNGAAQACMIFYRLKSEEQNLKKFLMYLRHRDANRIARVAESGAPATG